MAFKVLQKFGYSVLCARDGQEALIIRRQHKEPVQLMLTVWSCPRMSGKELEKRLEELCSEMKVHFISRYTDNAIVRYGMLDEGIAFIRKPFAHVDPARRVRKALDKLMRVS